MRFGILGPLLVDGDDGPVEVPGARQRVLLATLLLHARRTVSLDTLAEAVWEKPSPGAAATLRTYVMRLRRTLGAAVGARLVVRPSGYLIEAADDEVDVLRFDRLHRAGGTALRSGSWSEASGLLADALALWRDAPLVDVPSEVLHRDHVPRLEQQRLQAIEWRIDAELELGRHADVVADLRDLTARYPLREHVQMQLMLALYRSDRQAEALDVYRDLRARLVDELGVEPSPSLQRLHRRILRGDEVPMSTASPAPSERVPPSSGGLDTSPDAVAVGTEPAPAQLPADVAVFVGRRHELSELDLLLADPGTATEPRGGPAGAVRRAPVMILAVSGPAGVGKTALAVRWAHRARDRFPDGQLYVNLRGYDPEQPVEADHALAGFLEALGVPVREIPRGLAERAARYRTETASRRMLVVLDNAASVAQVRPLLPGSGTCAVLITSRDSLPGLVAVDGARRLTLDVLAPADALALLRQLIGARVDEQPEAARTLAARCARLPLALRVAAELAAARSTRSLEDLVAELGDQRRRLDLLDVGGDPHAAVRTVFSWSYRHLPAATARVFRLLGLHPGTDIDGYATAALAGGTLEQARTALSQLTRAHLIQQVGPDRYAMHDLLRAYAVGLAADRDGAQGTRTALDRLFGYYLRTTGAAVATLHPAEASGGPGATPPGTPVPSLTEPAAALPWLEGEMKSLIAVAGYTAERGRPEYTIALAAALIPYLRGARYADAVAIHAHAGHAARQTGDLAGEAEALRGAGHANSRVGRIGEAATQLRQALELFRAAGDTAGQARALNDLSITEFKVGDLDRGLAHLKEALSLFQAAGDRLGHARALFNLATSMNVLGRHEAGAGYLERALVEYREVGDRLGEAQTLTSLAVVGMQLGRYEQSTEWLLSSLELNRAFGHREGEAFTLNVLGDIEQRIGRYDEAAGHLQQALALARQLGNRERIGWVLDSLGGVHLRRGRHQAAADCYQQAAALFRAGGVKVPEVGALNGLGEATCCLGHPAEAVTHHTDALRIATALALTEHQKRAHTGLGDAYRALGDHATARRHYHQVQDLSAGSGVSLPAKVRAYLAAVDVAKGAGPGGSSPA